MDFKKPIETILAKDMNRKEFLLHVGAASLALAGVSGVIKALTDPHMHKQTSGYGASPYGGNTAARTSVPQTGRVVRLG